MENLVQAEKISISKNKVLLVKIQNYRFPMIYRSAMGVYWDEREQSVVTRHPINQDKDICDSYKQIMNAIYNEYGKILCVSENTIFESIDANCIITLSNLSLDLSD